MADFVVGIASTVATNALLDGAGIGIGSVGIRKTITWNNTAGSLTSSEDWNIATGKQYEIAGTSVLNATTLGSGVVNSSLTSVGTLGQLSVTGVSTASRFVSNVATGTAPLTVSSTTLVTNLNADLLDGLNSASTNTVSTIVARDASGNFSAGTITATSFSGSLANTLTLNTSGTGLSGSTTFNNSGAATFTVTSNATSANTVSTIVARDASGNFSAGTITASLTGAASLNVLKAGDTMTGQLISTLANNTATGGGQIYLNGATGNRIDFNSNGVAAPTTTTRSAGTKLVLWPGLSATNVDYALGIDSSTMWYSVDTTSAQFKWFAGTSNIATLTGAGNFSATGSITGNTIVKSGGTSTQFLKADGSVDTNTYITSASVGNGTLTLGVSGTGLSGSASFTANQSGNTTFTVTSNATSANTVSTIVARDASGNFSAGTVTATSFSGSLANTLTLNTSGTGLSGSTTFNNSGAATFTVTSNATSANTVSTIVARDASGNFSAGTISAALSASADAAIVNQNNGNASAWYGRILSKNSTSDKASFLGTYGSIAGVFAHNNALSAWTDLYVNTVDGGSNGGTVRMPPSVLVNGNQVWHAGNDGAGSGLDADLIDGINSTGLFNNMGATHTSRSSFDATTPSYDFGFRFVQGSTNGPGTSGTQFYSWYIGLGSDYAATGAGSYGAMFAVDRNVTNPYLTVRYNEGNAFTSWYKIRAGAADILTTARTINGTSFDGSANITITSNTPNTLTLNTSGTGLSGSTTFNGSAAATFTVTSNATSANTVSTIVARDASGNFSAGTITATLSGSSSSVANSVTFNSGGSGAASGTTFNGSAAQTISYNTIGASPLAGSTSLTTTGTVTTGTWSGSFGAVSGANLTSLTAGNLSGTIPSAVLGNSAHFIGTTSIALNRASASQSLTGVNIDGSSGSCTGNAATATTLQTARNIGGTSFNGSADITPFRTNTIAVIDGGTLQASGATYAARSASSTPQQLTYGLHWEFKNAAVVGGAGNYAGLLTLAPYNGTTSSTGDPNYQLAFSPASANSTAIPTLQIRAGIDATWGSWATILNSSNYTSYVGNGTLTLAVSGTGLSGSASFTANQSGNTTFTVTSNATSANTASTIVARDASGNITVNDITAYRTSATGTGVIYLNQAQTRYLYFDGTNYIMPSSNLTLNGSTAWHAGNDGAGSGLDADLLDGLNATSANTVSTIVARDASGNFSAGTITATLSGSSSSVANSVTFNSGGSGAASGTTFNGSAAQTISYNTIGASPLAGSTSLTTTGTVTTGTWSGSFGAVSGANLTSLTAGNLSGTIPSAVLGNSVFFIGTTSIALNRASASQSLTGIVNITASGNIAADGAFRAESSDSTQRFDIYYNEAADSLDFDYLTA